MTVSDRLAAHEAELARRDARIGELELANTLLKVERRVARIEVPAQDGGTTTVRFQELDEEGLALGPERTFTIDGRVLYVDGLVIKFEDRYVESGDALRGASICLLRRLFGEDQKPRDGFSIDREGEPPLPYGDDAGDIWQRFWDYANDPARAAKAGVRALHGEAPYIELRAGKSYVVELRASGGLTIRPTN